MFYHLFYPLRIYFFPFNVFKYITFRAGGAIFTSLVLSLLFAPLLIKKLKQFHIGQQIREDGPPTHMKKAGTPTMGGLIILFSLIVSTFLWARLDNRFTIIILLSTLWLGVLGFLDDYLKLVKKRSRGLKARYKLLGQSILAIIIVIYLYYYPANPAYITQLNIPYLKDFFINLGWLYALFAILLVVGSSNAVNLTDGLDGLAVGSILISAMTYALMAYLAGHAQFSSYLRIVPVPGAGELSIFLASMAGAGLGFLWFNSYPAEVFMGDTGSLFLGGTIGIVALLIKQELLLVIVGGIFVVEALSVILQVASFKLRGKRILKMAPLHHHFELIGWSEPKVVIRFWIVGIILALIALSALKLR
jgi:phospho-N-acetylmuramoyl-pentapeptide-transferase